MRTNNPIGIFDSGVGGLSVWKELISIMPNESFLYFADSQFSPYGFKSQEAIIERCEKIVDFFIEKKAKMVVVACNTATAAAIDFLRQAYPIPFIGMEPAVKPAAKLTQTGVIGVLATEGTLNGRLFNNTSQKYASHIRVETQVGKGFVELVENGEIQSENARQIVSQAVLPLVQKGIDYLVLACTHYPFLMPTIENYTQNHKIKIINPAMAVAKQAQRVLSEQSILNSETNKSYQFYSSSQDFKVLKSLVCSILNHETKANHLSFSFLDLED